MGAGSEGGGMNDRQMHIHCAHAYLTESRKRGATSFGWLLLTWARNARLRAAAASEPMQGGLFG